MPPSECSPAALSSGGGGVSLQRSGGARLVDDPAGVQSDGDRAEVPEGIVQCLLRLRGTLLKKYRFRRPSSSVWPQGESLPESHSQLVPAQAWSELPLRDRTSLSKLPEEKLRLEQARTSCEKH